MDYRHAVAVAATAERGVHVGTCASSVKRKKTSRSNSRSSSSKNKSSSQQQQQQQRQQQGGDSCCSSQSSILLVCVLLSAGMLFIAAGCTAALRLGMFLFGQEKVPSYQLFAYKQQVHRRLLQQQNKKPFYHPDDILEWNPIYRVPEASEIVGDRSDEYATLRAAIDPILPDDPVRSRLRVQELTEHEFTTFPMKEKKTTATTTDGEERVVAVPYDIYNCPNTPPVGYPYSWKILDLLENWPADDVKPRPNIHQGLCVFDYETEYHKAVAYRDAELPFVVANDPAVAKTAERWSVPGYMENLLAGVHHRAEFSENNHFMYYNPELAAAATAEEDDDVRSRADVPEGWKKPTKHLRMTYEEWVRHANVSDDLAGPDHPHWYFRLIGCGLTGSDGSCDEGSSEYLFDEMPYFQPKESLYIVEPEEQMGIHCRFGMTAVIAENHFDQTRNAIVVLGGSRRYILSHPNQCRNLALYPKGHPSARHSEVDWTDPDLDAFPQFRHAEGNEVVMQAGQVMYLPTNWFHYIISLSMNFQCNTRSGVTDHYPLDFCGF